jgi:adenylate cyclase
LNVGLSLRKDLGFIWPLGENFAIDEGRAGDVVVALAFAMKPNSLLNADRLDAVSLDPGVADFTPQVYRLRFDKALERRFQGFYYQSSIHYIRIILGAFFCGMVAFGLSDYLSLPQTFGLFWLVRYGILCPVFAIAFLFSLKEQFQRSMQWVMSLTYLIGGLGMTMIGLIAQPQEPGYQLYFLGLVFVILGAYLSRIQFFYATVVGWIIWFTYALVGLVGQAWLRGEPSVSIVLSNLFYLAFINFAGMLASYMLELSVRLEFLQRRAIAYERRKSEHLLKNLLPHRIAARLKTHSQPIAQEYQSVTILFADLVGFTALSHELSAPDLVDMLDELFSRFDLWVEHYELEKIKTIGDCYMAAGGVPIVRDDHAIVMTDLAFAMMTEVQDLAAERQLPLNLRVGIHSGPVVAGVIGRKRWFYDLWGETVNVASRMESQGLPGMIQISEDTYKLIASEFCCEAQGEIGVKGIGPMAVWHVRSRLS